MSEQNQAINEILAEKAEEMKIETGADGEPIIKSFINIEPPPIEVPVHFKRPAGPAVEVVPGVMVSQTLIDEAVRLTSSGPVSEDHVEAIERKHLRVAQEHAEIKQDISTSKQIVESMLARMREPVNPDEKYISYDSMPAPLQRVVKAYIDVGAANNELAEAIKGLQQMAPPTTN